MLNRPQTVALGHGIHYCLGAPLARLEGRIALQTVFERWSTIRQAGELEYADNFKCGYCALSLLPRPERKENCVAAGEPGR